jgi:transposase
VLFLPLYPRAPHRNPIFYDFLVLEIRFNEIFPRSPQLSRNEIREESSNVQFWLLVFVALTIVMLDLNYVANT